MAVFQGSTHSRFQITREVNIHNNIQKIIFKLIFQNTSNIFCHIKNLLQQWNKNYFKEIHHQLFSNQSIELSSSSFFSIHTYTHVKFEQLHSSSSEIENIIQKAEIIFQKNPTIGLPEVSRLINSAISKRHEDQRKHSFLEKKKTP